MTGRLLHKGVHIYGDRSIPLLTFVSISCEPYNAGPKMRPHHCFIPSSP